MNGGGTLPALAVNYPSANVRPTSEAKNDGQVLMQRLDNRDALGPLGRYRFQHVSPAESKSTLLSNHTDEVIKQEAWRRRGINL
jgi:hypothetical protein